MKYKLIVPTGLCQDCVPDLPETATVVLVERRVWCDPRFPVYKFLCPRCAKEMRARYGTKKYAWWVVWSTAAIVIATLVAGWLA